MHIVLLILAIAGQPERIAAVLNDEQHTGMEACNRLGVETQQAYASMFDREPREVSYRCIPGYALKVTGT